MLNTVKRYSNFILILVLVWANTGIIFTQHQCTSKATKQVALIKEASCCSSTTCCKEQNKCCENLSFFKKFDFDGVVATKVQIVTKTIISYCTPIFFNTIPKISYANLVVTHLNIMSSYVNQIKQRLKPDSISLQIFRC